MKNLLNHLGKTPDFPQKGVTFFDISPILHSPALWRYCVDSFKEEVLSLRPDSLVAIESRGFLIAAPVAYSLGIGFSMVRKEGKLPGKTINHSYDLEYGKDCLEIQKERVKTGERVVIVDDVLATGGTMNAAVQLLQKQNVIPVGGVCLLELLWLGGRKRVDVPLFTLQGIALDDV